MSNGALEQEMIEQLTGLVKELKSEIGCLGLQVKSFHDEVGKLKADVESLRNAKPASQPKTASSPAPASAPAPKPKTESQ